MAASTVEIELLVETLHVTADKQIERSLEETRKLVTMWVIEEFDDDSHVRDYGMPTMEDDLLRSLIQIRNTEDWIRGVGHPIELSELSRFTQYLREELEPNTLHTYFATYFRD